MFFLNRYSANQTYKNIANNIRNDLKATFEKKGIDVTKIYIDVNSGNLSVQVYVGQNQQDVIEV